MEKEKEQANQAQEKSKNKIFFIVFGIIWFAIILWNILSPNQAFSEAENRTLAKFPTFSVDTLLDGDYMDGVSTYLNDHFAGRPYWVSGQSLAEYGIGKREINDIFIGKNALLASGSPADESIAQNNIAGVNALAEQYGVPTYMLLVPSSTAIQPQKLPAFAEGWGELDFIDDSYAKLKGAVKPINAWQPLQQDTDEYIYYRTDHHWTTYGASIAYKELSKTMCLPNRTDEFEKQTLTTNFEGTYQSKTGFPLVEADIIELYQAGEVTSYEVFDGEKTQSYDSIYFPEYLEKKDKYSYFLGQVQPYVTIHTKANTGKSLIIFKDSYAHCMIPMLLKDYDEIRLVDLRYLNGNNIGEIIEMQNYDEALFLYSTDVFANQNVSGKLQ